MKNLNICIDIDGTITGPYYWLELANKYFSKNIKEEEITEYAIHKVMGIDEREYIEFYEKFKLKLHSEQKLRKDAKLIIKRLMSLHNIHFITARDKSLTMLTRLYLRLNDISYDSLSILGSHYKVDKARELNCSIFIEDSYDNAIQLSAAGFKVLLIDTNYNRKPLDENIIRVYNWEEIYMNIEELFLQIHLEFNLMF
jgi:uncharacterized protein